MILDYLETLNDIFGLVHYRLPSESYSGWSHNEKAGQLTPWKPHNPAMPWPGACCQIELSTNSKKTILWAKNLAGFPLPAEWSQTPPLGLHGIPGSLIQVQFPSIAPFTPIKGNNNFLHAPFFTFPSLFSCCAFHFKYSYSSLPSKLISNTISYTHTHVSLNYFYVWRLIFYVSLSRPWYSVLLGQRAVKILLQKYF